MADTVWILTPLYAVPLDSPRSAGPPGWCCRFREQLGRSGGSPQAPETSILPLNTPAGRTLLPPRAAKPRADLLQALRTPPPYPRSRMALLCLSPSSAPRPPRMSSPIVSSADDFYSKAARPNLRPIRFYDKGPAAEGSRSSTSPLRDRGKLDLHRRRRYLSKLGLLPHPRRGAIRSPNVLRQGPPPPPHRRVRSDIYTRSQRASSASKAPAISTRPMSSASRSRHRNA